MASKDEIHKIWAPPGGMWSPWVKPVLFSFTDAIYSVPPTRSFVLQKEWVPKTGSTAFVVDLPEEAGILWGIRMAELGYRPVPLYNALPFAIGDKLGTPSSRPTSTVHVEPILGALVRESTTLGKLKLPLNSPPAFLLDSDRRTAKTDILPGVFDNRSVCFITDFPSAAFLIEHGINKVVVVQGITKFPPDLTPVLIAWQQGGIKIFRKLYQDTEPPAAVVVEKPSFLSRIWFRLSVALGFHRGELGAFGEIVPASSG
jgi:hypothetical protein